MSWQLDCHKQKETKANSTFTPPSSIQSTNQSMDSPANHPIVLKFGGTSLGKHLSSIPETILPALLSSNRSPVLVLSARSNDRKCSGTTTLLLRACALVERVGHGPLSPDLACVGSPRSGHGSLETIEGVLEEITAQHLSAAESVPPSLSPSLLPYGLGMG